YSVTVTDVNGCSSSLTDIEITQPGLLQAYAEIVDPILCFGDKATVSVTASGGTPFDEGALYSGIGERVNVEPGNFSFGVIDKNGCTATAIGTNADPLLLEVALDDQTLVLCVGENTGTVNVTASGGTAPYTYVWTGPDGFNSNNEDLNE